MVDKIKLFDITIDSKLTFKDHVADICRKVTNIYKQVARIAKMSWGLDPEITWYTAIIEPIILYAASVWYKALDKISIRKKQTPKHKEDSPRK